MADYKIVNISNLPEATSVTDSDMLLVIQNGAAKRVPPSLMKGDTGFTPVLDAGNVAKGDEPSISFTQNGTDSKGNPIYLLNITLPKGDKGDTGKTPVLGTVTTTTGSAGSSATAAFTLNGTDSNGNPKYDLALTIPRGAKGDTGATGQQGIKGDTGDSGVAISDTEPTDANVDVWIKGNGDGDEHYIKTEVDNLLAKKVDKETGKGLSTNDYDNTEKAQVETDKETNVLQDTVTAEALAKLINEVNALKKIIASGKLGDIHVASLTSDTVPQYCEQQMIIKGSGSPVTNAVTPDFEGQIYIDTTNRNAYMCCDSASISYWKQLN